MCVATTQLEYIIYIHQVATDVAAAAAADVVVIQVYTRGNNLRFQRQHLCVFAFHVLKTQLLQVCNLFVVVVVAVASLY